MRLWSATRPLPQGTPIHGTHISTATPAPSYAHIHLTTHARAQDEMLKSNEALDKIADELYSLESQASAARAEYQADAARRLKDSLGWS